jgi:hypothetical protein
MATEGRVSNYGAKVGYAFGTLAMILGWLYFQAPISHNDPNLPGVITLGLVISLVSIALLTMPMIHLYRITKKGADLVIFMGFGVVVLQVLYSLTVIVSLSALLIRGA